MKLKILTVIIAAGSLVGLLVATGVVLATFQAAPSYDPLGISPADATALPPAKRAIWEQMRQEYEAGVAAGLPTPSNPSGTLKPVAPSAWTEGYLPKVSSFGGWVLTSGWGAELPDRHLRVYAGFPRDNPSVGVVVIRSTPKDPALSSQATEAAILVPSAKGALRVVSGDASRSVRLLSNSGRGYRVDVAAGSVTELATANGPAGCCSLALDADLGIAGVQPVGGFALNSTASIGVILGESVGDLGAFNFKLIYDDTRLAPVAGGGSSIEGNPDFNQQALGAQWTCSLPAGSATADIDPATGPGHGVAFLSCFTTSAAPVINNGVIVATLTLKVLVAGETGITIAEANFAHADSVEIGSCAPVTTTEMTCAGATINGQ